MIITADGKIISDRQISDKNIFEKIDFTNDPIGTYFIELHVGDEKLVQRVVKN